MIFFRLPFFISSIAFSLLYCINASITNLFVVGVVAAVISIFVIFLVEFAAKKVKFQTSFSAITGLFFGLLLGFMVNLALQTIDLELVQSYLFIAKPLIYHVSGFFVMVLFVVNSDKLSLFDMASLDQKNTEKETKGFYKILDTSVIIDGRISDICETGFIDGTLIIPNFVLNELQMIADSADSIKRNRGRRGLDILNKIQKDQDVSVKISDIDFKDIHEVDAKLVQLAKVMKAKVVTNDFNLNKVAEFHGVEVLNINQLSNALKPVVLPGEEMKVALIKEGKDASQAIGYLDDGTMVVVENGREKLNSDVKVIVTSVLQTSAGRMIFARLKESK